MPIYLFLLVTMLLVAVWTVMARSLLKATIGLAVTSTIITILMFLLDSPLAAVFELSVCAGLITVVFVSAISLTKPLTHKEIIKLSRDRIKRFWYLPVILAIAALLLSFVKLPNNLILPKATEGLDARMVLWNTRQIDLLGQIIIIIAGAIGVVILFIERRDDE